MPEATSQPVPSTDTEWNREVARRFFAALRAMVANPGIDLPRQPGVPLFYADNTCPGVMIRELDGRMERGHIIEGTFCPLPDSASNSETK